ncbi:MAG: TetR/AcrR family transcriptional regulator [Chloroflexi bacterium]|nr:TetR/AcrR family transcriptional regulator [Chloroflexota bacterium]
MVRKYRNTQVRQKQIITSARRLIFKYGSEHVTVRRIARDIGISEGALYRHFKSKRDILSLLVDDVEANWLSDIEEGKTGETSPLKVLQNIAHSHISLVEQRRGITFQVVAEIISLGDKRLNEKIDGAIRRYTEKIKALLADGVRAGEISESISLDAVATLFFSMTQGLVTIWVLTGYSFDLLNRYGDVWQIFCRAIVKD